MYEIVKCFICVHTVLNDNKNEEYQIYYVTVDQRPTNYTYETL